MERNEDEGKFVLRPRCWSGLLDLRMADFFFFRIKVFDGIGEHIELWCERTNVEDADWVGERDRYRETAGAHVDTVLDVVKRRMPSSLAQDFFALPLSFA